MKRTRFSGFSIPELLIVSFIFAIFLTVSYLILNQGMAVWGKSESSKNVSFQLQKARSALNRDLLQASRVELEASGSKLWFLSSIAPDGVQAQHDDGRPFWQRNILYYLAKPLDHDKIFKVACADPNQCPHKVLIRKTIDRGAPTTPQSLVSQEEKLMEGKETNSYAVPPNDLYPQPEIPGVERVDVVATGLLDLNFSVDPKSVSKGEVQFVIKGFDLTKGNERVDLGKDDLHKSPLAIEVRYSVFLPD